ncbi:hypothetical protein DAPPUDRAFT_345357 [Daphnia pulex]|uniref:Uncharacterized protein n=1 Tax=Daphnia pulex TaxID=6669 RepID=E9I7C6_DAPPU|nr:hypothetical protein DAPPUDRAFT_345357 [Daphnia pulex]|eukprot:EFX60104.1 hypothetical protein DAPPUDRAFT_345357 [Daphnia pulex]
MMSKKSFYSETLCAFLVLGTLQACGDGKKNNKAGPLPSPSPVAGAKIYLDNIEEGKPLLLIYGDSISTGVLSNTTLGQAPDTQLTAQLGSYIKSGQYTANGFQAGVANQNLAASTTKEGYGVRQGLAAQKGIMAQDVGVISLARFGAKADDIPKMITDWKNQKSESQLPDPEFVLVALGANDFCSDLSPQQISAHFNEQIEAVHQLSPNAQLIISAAPPVPSIAPIEFTYQSDLTAITGEELSCRKFREQYCKPLFAPDAAARMAAINAGIEAASNVQKEKGTDVIFVDGIKDWKISPDELSFDCFHPSKKGQETLGRLIQASLAAPAS